MIEPLNWLVDPSLVSAWTVMALLPIKNRLAMATEAIPVPNLRSENRNWRSLACLIFKL